MVLYPIKQSKEIETIKVDSNANKVPQMSLVEGVGSDSTSQTQNVSRTSSLRHSSLSNATSNYNMDMNRVRSQEAVLNVQIGATNPIQYKTWYQYISQKQNNNQQSDHFHLFASHLVRYA